MIDITHSKAHDAANAYHCVLSRLPREIRDLIYRFVLAPPSKRSVVWDPRGSTFPGDAFPLDIKDAVSLMGNVPAYIGLLQTCKYIHHEVASLLYNTVEINLRADQGPEKALQRLGLQHVRYIKHITIEFRQYVEDPVSLYETRIATLGAWRAAAVLRLLERAGTTLHTVVLKAPWHCRGCPGSGRLVHMGCVSIQPLLRDASNFSNVQTVIFTEYVALWPSRINIYNKPARNRPLTEIQKDEIIRRLDFQASGATAGTAFQLSAVPLPKGFFSIENPRVSFGSEDTLPPPCEAEWRDTVQEHLAQLKSFGFAKERYPWIR